MSAKMHYRLVYNFLPEKPTNLDSDRGMGTVLLDRSYVEVHTDGRFVTVQLIEHVTRTWDTDDRWYSRREWWIQDEATFDLQDLLLKRGTYQLLHHSTAFKTLARETIQALIEGSLPLTIAKNTLEILLPLMIKEKPELGRVMKHLKPYYLDEPPPPKKPPRKKK